jgi:hypothetical protein
MDAETNSYMMPIALLFIIAILYYVFVTLMQLYNVETQTYNKYLYFYAFLISLYFIMPTKYTKLGLG